MPPDRRAGTWETRQAGARELHDILRGDRPGWGPFETFTARQLAAFVVQAEAYARAKGLLVG